METEKERKKKERETYGYSEQYPNILDKSRLNQIPLNINIEFFSAKYINVITTTTPDEFARVR